MDAMTGAERAGITTTDAFAGCTVFTVVTADIGRGAVAILQL